MKKIVLFLVIVTLGHTLMGQNSLRAYLKSNASVYYSSPSKVHFSHTGEDPVFIGEIRDNRSTFWNKTTEDSTKVEMIRDFWNYPFKSLWRTKLSEDLSKKYIKIDFQLAEHQYIIEPQIDIFYPEWVSNSGYKVHTLITMKASRDQKTLIEKSYSDTYAFTKEHEEFKPEYLRDIPTGVSVALWIGMSRALDKFYVDLNQIFQGKTPEMEAPLEETKSE